MDARHKARHDEVYKLMTSTNEVGERIAKVIARAGLTSRREAEAWIAAGRVAVNGIVVRSPALNITARDRVAVDGEPLPGRERTRLFLYHKPRGLLTSHTDPRGRPTIFRHLPRHLPRLISVGRLDFNTEGLILLTNDGALARVLELPTTGWLRCYRVRAHGSVTQAKLDELRAGVTIDGIHYGAIEAMLERVQGSNVWLMFAIREGKNREVRNVLGHLGLTVARLIRISFGPFQLADLAEGAVDEVPTHTLREQLGEQVVTLSGADFSSPISAPPPVPAPSDKKEEARGVARSKATRGKSSSHSWRAHEQQRPAKKFKRKFHGTRRDKSETRQKHPGPGRADVLSDRKGRAVRVERFGQPRLVQEPVKPSAKRDHRRRRAPDRAFGARPRRPRPH